MPRPVFPAWLRRALECALAAALVAIVTLAGDRLAAPGGTPTSLPAGLPGALLLAPAVFALGVIPAAYPVAMSATRGDAVLGAVAGWLVAVDLTVLFAGGGHVSLDRVGGVLPTALLVGLLALAGLVAGLVASQLAGPLGFGRRAGAVAAIAAAIGSLVALALVSLAA